MTEGRVLVLAMVVFVLLLLQGGRPIPSSGYCEHPCVVVEIR